MQKRGGSTRWLLAIIAVILECTLPVRLAGDYLVYRLGLAGTLRRSLPAWFIVVSFGVTTLLTLLGLPLLCLVLVRQLSPLGWPPALSAAVTVALTAGIWYAARRFSRGWADVETYCVGTAGKLQGRCAVFQVFLGSRWRPRHHQEVLRSVRTACDWLERRAAERAVHLEMVTEPYEVTVLDDAPARDEELKHPDAWKPYRAELDALRGVVETHRPQWTRTAGLRAADLDFPKSSLLIVHVTQPSTVGFALPARNDLGELPEIETCVCGRRSGPAVHAHEILHLFGAPDLYSHPWHVLVDDEVRPLQMRLIKTANELLQAHFGRSIMCGVTPDLRRLEIDPITARAVGWQDADPAYQAAALSREETQFALLSAVLERSPHQPKA